MQLLIEENLGMLNNMSEGLFLADQKNAEINFCNKPALAIFQGQL